MADADVSATVNAAILARLMNLTERRIGQMAKEGIIPRAGRGKYPLAAALRAAFAYYQQANAAANGNGGEIDPDKLDQFKRKAYYRAELDKTKLLQESGELIPRAEVQRDWALMCSEIKQVLSTAPDLVERAGASNDVVLTIERCMSQLSQTIAERLRGVMDPELNVTRLAGR